MAGHTKYVACILTVLFTNSKFDKRLTQSKSTFYAVTQRAQTGWYHKAKCHHPILQIRLNLPQISNLNIQSHHFSLKTRTPPPLGRDHRENTVQEGLRSKLNTGWYSHWSRKHKQKEKEGNTTKQVLKGRVKMNDFACYRWEIGIGRRDRAQIYQRQSKADSDRNV